MSESIALIVGGSGVAGQSALEAFREDERTSGRKWKIFATTSGESPVSGADKTIPFIQLDEPETAVSRMKEFLQDERAKINVLIYTPAKGNLGYPVSESSDEDIRASLDFCFNPMLELEKDLAPRLTVAYSAYYYLPHLLILYGSVAFVKKKMEEWALQKPTSRKIIRAGSFFSQSARGFAIKLQRFAKSSPHNELQKFVEAQRTSGQKFGEFFMSFVQKWENDLFQNQFPNIPYRVTESKDLKLALQRILNGEKAPIVSLIGDWVWTEYELPPMPEYLLKA